MNIQLTTGKTISMSVYEYFFILKDEEMDAFYQDCIADDLGTELNNPFSNKSSMGKLEIADEPEIEDVEDISD